VREAVRNAIDLEPVSVGSRRLLCRFSGKMRDRFKEMAMGANAGTRKKWKVFRILAILAMGIPPLLNSIGNPRLAGLSWS
jgi:hypothetical protein